MRQRSRTHECNTKIGRFWSYDRFWDLQPKAVIDQWAWDLFKTIGLSCGACHLFKLNLYHHGHHQALIPIN